MAKNTLASPQFRDGEVRRADLCTTVAADAVIAKLVPGTGITITQSGAAAGTGDVTVNVAGVPIVNDVSTNATMYPMWVTATTGALPPKVSSTKLTFNPATGRLSLAEGLLALGAVPSTAFASSLSAFSMGNVNIVAPKAIGANSYFYICNNMLFDGGAWRAISTDAGSIYYMQNGFHAWVNAASVAAGATQTFVERMRLYLSGGLFLGTSPADPGVNNMAIQGYLQGQHALIAGRLIDPGSGNIHVSGSSGLPAEIQFYTYENSFFEESARIIAGATSGGNWHDSYLLFQTHGTNAATFSDDIYIWRGTVSFFGGILDISLNKITAQKPIKLMNYTVATLPTGTLGETAIVSDANAPVFGNTVAGGGAVKVPVYHDGTNWKVG